MLAFTLRRILQALGVLLAVGVLSFAMFRFAGDPVSQIVSLDTPPEQRAEVRKSLTNFSMSRSLRRKANAPRNSGAIWRGVAMSCGSFATEGTRFPSRAM